jgi:hypothetical protein
MFFFVGVLEVKDENSDQDLMVSGTDPQIQIRICTKMSGIHNT